MKVYEGLRTENGCAVTVDHEPLPLRHDLRNHSPTGAEWGYAGSGPAQLALALLADALGDDDLAQDHYQKFKFQIVARLERQQWKLTQAEIRNWIARVLSATDARHRIDATNSDLPRDTASSFPMPESPSTGDKTPLWQKLYTREHYVEVARIIGYAGLDLPEAHKRVQALFEKYGEDKIKQASDDLLQYNETFVL